MNGVRTASVVVRFIAPSVVIVRGIVFICQQESRPSRFQSYRITHSITADFEGDGRRTTVFAACAAKIGDQDAPSVRLWMTRGNRTVWTYRPHGPGWKSWKFLTDFARANREKPEKALQAVDLSGDGKRSLVFRTKHFGGSGDLMGFHAFGLRNGKVVNLISHRDGELTYTNLGGLRIVHNGRGKPARLLRYDWVGEVDEAHYDAHRYWAEWYTLKNGQFVLTKRATTKRKYFGDDECLTELVVTRQVNRNRP